MSKIGHHPADAGLHHTTALPSAALPIAAPGSAIDQLAERMGIVGRYRDAHGRDVAVTIETQRALLGAMGCPVQDERDAVERLRDLDETAASHALPPVVVSTDPWRIPLTVRADDASRARWRITEEGGEERAALAPVDDGLHLDRPLPFGRHRLRREVGDRVDETVLVVAPARCFVPPALAAGHRLYGLAAQVYALRSEQDERMGGFRELRRLVRFAGARGADIIGLNPLHALFLDRPTAASPYSPASRLFLNPLYIDPAALPDQPSAGARATREPTPRGAGEGSALIDHAAVAAALLPALEAAHERFLMGASAAQQAAFAAFRAEGGAALERFAIFQALREHHAGEDPGAADWRRWPSALRSADAPGVAAFARDHAARVAWFAWLQWVADEQLADVAAVAAEAGMGIGLYRDLAVGADAGGAETWANPGIVVSGARVGAPPDLFNPAGQDWGLPPFDPNRLRAEAHASFVELVRANMRHAGGLRIDHVMALRQLWWVPEGGTPADGAYVRYPLDELVACLALESARHRCLVVGEDLGTVPPGFRERMADAAIQSYRVVFFEWEDDGSFKSPESYPAASVATVGSHDLATLRGWWEGSDVVLKAEAGLFPSDREAAEQQARRVLDRQRLVAALDRARIALPSGLTAEAPWEEALAVAVHAFLARTGSAIAMVQLEDLARDTLQVNLPGSIDQHPNWRRRLGLTLEELERDPMVAGLLALMAAARPPLGTAASAPAGPSSPPPT